MWPFVDVCKKSTLPEVVLAVRSTRVSAARPRSGVCLDSDADIERKIRKLVIIGDGACGKTSLLSVFTLGYFPTVSSPLGATDWTPS